jgi:hypothetical protein
MVLRKRADGEENRANQGEGLGATTSSVLLSLDQGVVFAELNLPIVFAELSPSLPAPFRF